MARHEQDREDLMVEATALVERVELRVPHEAEPIVLGVRASGCLSIYFGADPALHFNTQGELRRAFVAGQLLTAEAGRIVLMTRRRAEGEVQLLRRDVAETEATALRITLQTRIEVVRTALLSGTYELLRQVPVDAPFAAEVWRERLPREVIPAQEPHAR